MPTLYHGSNQSFDIPDLDYSRDKRDFGKGFYLTTIKEQAATWAANMCIRYGSSGIYVYTFSLDIQKDFKVKIFKELCSEWLEMVKVNRVNGGTNHIYDVVQGPVANDNTMRTIELFIAGVYTEAETLEKLRYFKANDQVSLHTQLAMQSLTLVQRESNG